MPDVFSQSRDFYRGPFFSPEGENCEREANAARRERIEVFALVGLASLALFWAMLPPSVARGGDSGELISASYHLGIGHPSGYPVWCLLGRIFAFWPGGEIAWRYNLFSAVCGSAAAALLAVSAHRVLFAPHDQRRAQIAATGAGLLLSGFFFFGTQAILAEVYALAALEGAALFFFALRWKQNGDFRDLYLFAFLAGLSPLVHLSGVFLWPILGVWVGWKAPRLTASRLTASRLTASRLMTGFALFLSGLLPLLYLPIRSRIFPSPPLGALDSYFYFPLDWGHPANFAALKAHITGAQYRVLLQPREIGAVLGNGWHLFQFLWLQYLWATPLLLWGALSAFRRGLGWVLALIWVFNVGVEIQYDVGDQSNFFFPAYLVMALWMALGWCELLTALQHLGARWSAKNPLWPWRLRTVGTVSLAATIAAQWFLFGAGASQRGAVRPRDGALESARAAQNLARRSGKTVAALYVFDDTLWPFWYAKTVLGAAPDVETPWGRGLSRVYQGGKLADYVAQLKRRGPVVVAQWDERTDARFPLVMLTPSGNLCEASNRALPPAAAVLANALSPTTPGANGLVAARFRRARLWRSRGTEIPAFSPASLAAFEVDFRVSGSRVSGSIGSGGLSPRFIEVLLAQNGALRGLPRPSQKTLVEGHGETARVVISRQTRRLILPSQVASRQILRFSTPLQIEASSPLARYEVWTRMVRESSDLSTPWTRTDTITLTDK